MYSQWGVTWQPLLCESVAMVNTVSLGFVHDYLGRNGLIELMVRTGSLVPFPAVCGWSLSWDGIAATGGTISKK